jgi:phosphotransacetylase
MNGENSGIKKPFKHKYVMLDDDSDETSIMDLPDERSDKLADKVLLRIAYDTELREKIAALPDLQRVIVDIVNEHEERLSTRHIAREAAKRLGRNVTRHQMEIALAQLATVVGASLWRT